MMTADSSLLVLWQRGVQSLLLTTRLLDDQLGGVQRRVCKSAALATPITMQRFAIKWHKG